MKPPPRKRIKRDAAFKTERGSHCKLVCNWQRAEQRKLLSGLKALNKADGGQGDLDCAALKKYLPTRSTAEIESVIDKLKGKIISSMCIKVDNKRRDDKKVRKPIEMWTHLASTVVGTVEGPVTTAFSQMLLVSSTEPRTLRNCDPPQINRPPTAQNSHLSHTVPMRPMPRTPVQEPTTGPAKRPSAPPQAVGVANNTPPPPKQQQSPTAAGNPLLASTSSCQVSESVSAATLGHTQTTPPHQTTTTVCSATLTPAVTPLLSTSDGSLSLRPAAASSSGPTHTTSSSPPCLPKFGRTGKNATKGHHRGLGVKSIVDFEKIYKYLSVINKPGQGCELTCMESAIVLDLLMSLPEELPLLDCKNLQKHMVQVYQTLSVPADFKIVKELLKDLKEAGETEHPTAGSQAGPDAQSTRDPEANPQQEDHSGDAEDTGPKALRPQETHSQSPGNTNTHSQCEDEDLTGLCPPLNPFMVPLKLLMRKSSAK